MARVLGLLLAGLAGIACGGAQRTNAAAPAAADPADDLVRRVQDVYQSTQQLTVRFRQTNVNKTFGMPSVSDGTLYFKRPDRLRLDYHSRRDPAVVSRSHMMKGRTIVAVDRNGKWYYRQRVSDSSLPVLVAFLTRTGDLATKFDARLLTRSKHGAPTDKVLELTPKERSAQFESLVLVVDPSSFRVKKSIVTGKTGDTNELRFYEPDISTVLADAWFVFDPNAAVAMGFREIKP